MPAPDRATLDTALRDAHHTGDAVRISALYGRAGDLFDAAGDIDAACFFYTQAYVFALEAGLRDAQIFNARLKARNRI